MKSILNVILLAFCCIPLFLSAQQGNTKPEAQQMLNKTSHNFFIENKGQWPEEVRYLAKVGGMNAWITNRGVVYDYYKITRNFKSEQTMNLAPKDKDEFEREHSSMKGHVVDILLEGANTQAKAIPSGMHDGYYNYFIGNDSTKWASFVRLYSEILLQDIYPGIDIRYYFDNGLIRYDYIIRPGADLTQISLKINGSDGYYIKENGEITIKTNLGKITHGKLFAYQNIRNQKSEITCSFFKNQNGQVGVKAENYNPSLTLVIDPLVYSTFIGSSSDEECYSMAVDNNGNVVVCGITYSSNYPTTSGAYNVSFLGLTDGFVTKLNNTSSSLIYSTFMGGNSNDQNNSIVVDGNGNTFFTGYTSSTTYPTTTGAYDVSFNGGNIDVFITKLNASGSSLLYSTYLGGNDMERVYSIAIDGSGNAFVTGYTESNNFPVTSGAYDLSYNGGSLVGDGFVTKLNASGTALVYSTYIGGSTDDVVFSIAIDNSGNAFLAGRTLSSNYPTTTGAFDVSYNGGANWGDAFVTKLNASGSALLYSTYLGSYFDEIGYSITVDTSGYAFVTGYTSGAGFPTTTGAFQVSYASGWDIFVTKLNVSGSALVYSTYIGRSNNEIAYSIAIDSSGVAYITGYTATTNFPTTSWTYDATYNGNNDAFLTKLNSTGTAILYSTFIGGSNEDQGNSIAIDGRGNAYIAGYTSSTNYPTTSGAYNVSSNGMKDIFVTKIWTINPAMNITVSNISSSKANCKWIKGGGTKRAVFVNQTSYGTAFPIINTTYAANDTFGLGSQIGTTGWYCVYNDTGSSFTLTGLLPSTTYRVMVCEYTVTGGNETYSTDSANANPCNLTTLTTIQARNITFSNYALNSVTASWVNGNCSSRALFVCAGNTGVATPSNNTSYTADTVFGSGSQIGNTGWYCVYNGTGNTVNISGLASNTSYRMMVCEYFYTTIHEQYVTKSALRNPVTYNPVPTTQAHDVLFSSVTANSMEIAWTNGNGSGRAVFVVAGDTGTVILSDNTTYTADTSFGKGTKLGSTGWYCVYNGNANSVTVSGLSPTTTYRVMVCEYNGTAAEETYYTNTATNNPSNQTTDYAVPTIQSDGIIFSNVTSTSFRANWTKGNGSNRVAFIKAANTGAPLPVNNITYLSDTMYGLGSQLGTTGWYCVYNDTGTSVSISNLSPNTVYRLMVCEYNGIAGFEKYNITNAADNPANVSTDYEVPKTQARNIIFNNVTSTSFRASWTKGNGTSRAVFILADTLGYSLPLNNNTYTQNSVYGSGSQIGATGWYCVYNDTGSSVNVSNLSTNTAYRLMVCEYNGTAGLEKYNVSVSVKNPANTTTDYAEPATQASGISFSNVSDKGFTVSCTKGNGSKRAIFIREANFWYATPINNISYTPNPAFGSGTQIETTGWYCVYNDTGKSVNISNLNSNFTYRLMVCEYNGIPGSEKYNTSTSTNNPANQTTDFAKPTVQASNIIFSNITSSSADVSYTRGNGSSCLVLITEGTTPYPPLQDNNSYALSSQVGTSGWYCKYNGTANSVSLTGLNLTTYRLMVCEYNGTAGMEKYLTDTAIHNPTFFTTVSISDQVSPKINIYPNPTNGQLVIENAKGFKLTLFNALGELIYSRIVMDDTYTADLNNFGDGIYFSKLERTGISYSQKIIIRR